MARQTSSLRREVVQICIVRPKSFVSQKNGMILWMRLPMCDRSHDTQHTRLLATITILPSAFLRTIFDLHEPRSPQAGG